jgi:hypothetical protein
MKEQFEKIKLKYPDLSDIMCYIKLVKGKKINEKVLRQSFDDLVSRSEYQGTPKESIIKWLMREIIKK